MPVTAARLRRWFVGALVFVCVAVGGTYLYVRHRVENALKQIPGKLNIEYSQSAQEFSISKSLQGRTLFKVRASKAVQFKQGGHVELHDVTMTLYGRDSSRFDQVYGESFDYDPQSGDVRSKGEVSIDLQANPEGMLHPDQTAPKELKNPIHLKTSDLVFNKNSGDAWTAAEVEFRVPQASGSAMGARYVVKDAALTLESQIKIVMSGTKPGTRPGTILADHAMLDKAPREIVLTHPRAESPGQQAQADDLTLFLNDDNSLDHAVATGNVKLESRETAAVRTHHQPGAAGAMWSEVTAQRLDVNMKPDATVRDAVLSGDVRFANKGSQALGGSAARAVLDFGSGNSPSKVRAEGGVRLRQVSGSAQESDGRGRSSPQNSGGAGGNSGSGQNFQITAPAMDFFVAGQKLKRAETSGAPEILLSQAGADPKAAATRITADKFVAKFDALGQISQVHGAANAKIDSPGQAQGGTSKTDRVTTSDNIDAFFLPGTGIQTLVQGGHFTYRAGTQQAFADTARYTPADELLTLSGSPRIVDAGMETTAQSIRLDRATGDGFAQGDVKSSYSDLKAQPGGALLAGSDPVHVTAQSMTARNSPTIATYTGNARLWQNANVIRAPSIQFQKDLRTVIANSKGELKVSTVLVGTDKSGKATPMTVTSSHMVYRDSERKAQLDGGVTVHESDLTITAKQMDVYLAADSNNAVEARAPTPAQNATTTKAVEARAPSSVRNVTTGGAPIAPKSSADVASAPQEFQGSGPARLEKIVASGSVVVTEPARRATGEQLVYTSSDDKFVLTGGPPSIFDAEHGKITAVSLTLHRRDGRVVVEGDSSSPAVTQTQVVR
jgi:lipopolysaccharide export system protein LptA